MPNYIDELQWYHNYFFSNEYNVNPEKREIGRFWHRLNRQSPETRLELCKEGAELAQKIGEPFWYLLYANYQIEAMHELKMYKDWLDFATRLVVEIRKPEYRGSSMIANIYKQLIGAYYYHDPIGYSKDILDSVTYVEQNLAFSRETHLDLLEYRCQVYIAIEAWKAAKESSLNYQALAQDNHFHLLCSACFLAHSAYHLKDKRLLLNQSNLLISAKATIEQQRAFHIAGLYWQTVHAIMIGDKYKRMGATDQLLSTRNDKDISQPSDITVTAMFYYAEESQINLFQFISNYADTNVKSPYRNALHALRVYYLVAQLPYWEKIRYAGIRGFQQVGLIGKFVDWSVKLPKGLKHLAGLIILMLWMISGIIVIIINPPLREATLRVREYSQTSKTPEFFEERLRWIREKRNYIP